jgi:tRNA U34 5-methylaminomethyl-2-thiouridine-forming methyltransferase MnmC
LPVQHSIRFDENGAPISTLFEDPFFSRRDGPAETAHTFHGGNGLPERWAGCSGFVIGETGFGTGLNLIETIALWRACALPEAQLHYVSLEAFPLAKSDIGASLQAVLGGRGDRQDLVAALLDALPDAWPTGGPVRLVMHNVTADIVIGLAQETLPDLRLSADAWFLDGHSPAKNHDMWSPDLMRAVFDNTAPGGTFATYTAAGWVRRNLQAAGFIVEKRPGFGGKREMSRGVRPA